MIASLGACTIDRRPLTIAPYRRLWIASTVCAVGGSFSVVAVPTQLFTTTGSSATVGTAAAVSFTALVAAALWTGALADNMDRRKLLLAAHSGLALTYTALWIHAILGAGSIPILMTLVACQGLTFAAIMTTMGAIVPRLVPAELLPAANSLTSLTRYTGSILGPLLAGALIPTVGLGTLYLFDAIALLTVIRAVTKLPPLPPSPHPTTQRHKPTIGHIPAALRYLTTNRLLMAVLAVDLAAMVFGMPTALLPELAQHTYGGPSGGGPELGLLYAAYPAGVVTAGLLSGTFTRAHRHGALMAAAAAAWGITVILLGLTTHLTIALTALTLGGAVNFVLSTFRNAITQTHTPDALRGRIQGSLTVVLFGGPHIANLLHGATASVLDARTVIWTGGLLTTITVAAIAWAVPDLRTYTTRPATDPTPDSGTPPTRSAE
ncbi:MFS transporter [Nonomuraea sp. SYSU D8015]|uniref:MFS transporter n=1 Tax=Nonomuraea sp. SYSU D8015 TaxID=2593644 RepID=UPI001CB74BB1|nr:MFS transporter [Nonomuraea sp. SYSU D8015]